MRAQRTAQHSTTQHNTTRLHGLSAPNAPSGRPHACTCAGHHKPGTPAAKRMASGPQSRVLLFLSGHGGDEFFKFHDAEELLAADLARALQQMAAAGRWGGGAFEEHLPLLFYSRWIHSCWAIARAHSVTSLGVYSSHVQVRRAAVGA
jgi:hypothetical protein